MDLNLSNDPYESYRIFQGRIIDEYESMVQSEGLTVIDGTADIEEQQHLVRQKVIEILAPLVGQKIMEMKKSEIKWDKAN
jgi:dTMP kinase